MRTPASWLRSGVQTVLDMVAPPRPSEKFVRSLTLEALAGIQPTPSGALPYQDPRVRALVWEIKYYAHARALHLAGCLLAERLLEAASEHIGTPLLLPVPMHERRRRERGHNQTELLCRAALRNDPHLPILYTTNLLVRTKHTVQQQGLPEHKRRHNVRHTMHVTDPLMVHGRVCIVLDDVTTTGATFTEATRALKEAGARVVIPLALAQSA